MDKPKTLAERLAETKPFEKTLKLPHSLNLRHYDFLVLQEYCDRKKLKLGDVISDAIEELLLSLKGNGQLIPEDYAKAEKLILKKKRPSG